MKSRNFRAKLSCISSDSSLGTICCVFDHNSHNLWSGYRCLLLNKNSNSQRMDIGHASNFKLENLFHVTNLFLLPQTPNKFTIPDYSR